MNIVKIDDRHQARVRVSMMFIFEKRAVIIIRLQIAHNRFGVCSYRVYLYLRFLLSIISFILLGNMRLFNALILQLSWQLPADVRMLFLPRSRSDKIQAAPAIRRRRLVTRACNPDQSLGPPPERQTKPNCPLCVTWRSLVTRNVLITPPWSPWSPHLWSVATW